MKKTGDHSHGIERVSAAANGTTPYLDAGCDERPWIDNGDTSLHRPVELVAVLRKTQILHPLPNSNLCTNVCENWSGSYPSNGS